MTYDDDAGVRRTRPAWWAPELKPPGTGILPTSTRRSRPSPTASTCRAARGNMSAIWVLSLAKGLTDLLPTGGEPPARHQPTRTACRTPCGSSTTPSATRRSPRRSPPSPWSSPTAPPLRDLAGLQAEREAADGERRRGGAALAYVVELVEDELTVRGIHRPDLRALPEGSTWWRRCPPGSSPAPPPCDRPMMTVMDRRRGLCLVQPGRDCYSGPAPRLWATPATSTRSGSTWRLAALPTPADVPARRRQRAPGGGVGRRLGECAPSAPPPSRRSRSAAAVAGMPPKTTAPSPLAQERPHVPPTGLRRPSAPAG